MDQIRQKSQVQNYSLFGEAHDMPDVVHCESIATRSKMHNWEFLPHRHARLHQVLLVIKGGGKAKLEDRGHTLKPSTIVNVPIGCVHAFSFSKDTEGWVVTIGAEVMDEMLHNSFDVKMAVSQACVFNSSHAFQGIMHQIADEHANRHPARAHILRSLSALLIGHVARSISEEGVSAKHIGSDPLYHQFETLIDDKYLEHWSVSDYANTLAISPGHLSRITRATTGLSASRIIEERIIREARRHLAYTNLTISEIAYALGFFDPAYFSRVFTRTTGVSPRVFRMRLESSS